jgi:carbon-monoxide dehydrogenase medium subunit
MNTGLFRPASVAEALALLARLPEARIIAGGASLVAMINARLADPAALVSLARIEELQQITESPGGGLRIGAMARHRDLAAETRFSGTLAVVQMAAAQIANATVRNMGTIGGAVAHADPGLDYPPALVAAGAMIEIAAAGGRRQMPAGDFFVDWYATALQPGEMVAAVHLPAARPGVGLYHKFARVSGDYATVSVALTMVRDGVRDGVHDGVRDGVRDGAAIVTRAAIGGCGPTPLMITEANRLLSGDPTAQDLRRAGELLQAAADPVDDVRGSAEYRRMLIPRMLARAFDEARVRAAASP